MNSTLEDTRRGRWIRPTAVLMAVFSMVISLGYFDNPPNGYTGAPGDDLCTDCHTLNGGMQNGSIILSGFPATIMANQTYALTVTVTNPNGIADFAGFQTVILNASNQNAGMMSGPSAGSVITNAGGRTYHEHNPAQMFGAPNAIQWTVNWTAPVGSGLLTFYGAGNIANGNNSDSGDKIVTTQVSGTLMTALQASISAVEDVSCFGAMDGSVTVEASFGTPGYTYQWSSGGSGQMISNLGPGIYTVTVTDVMGMTATASAEVEQPPLLQISSAIVDNVSCNGGNDGLIILTLQGGVPPYSGAQGNNYTLANLEAGEYEVMVTDANGCLVSGDYTISEPTELIAEVSILIEPECWGDATGSICVQPSGGTGSVEYLWSTGSSSNCIQNLEAGVYQVTITDNNGCTATEIIPITEPEPIQIDLLVSQQVSCSGESDGQLIIEGNGGTGALTYQWSNGNTSPVNNNLAAGTYSVTVTDDNGCSDMMSYTITSPTALNGSISGTFMVDCFGGSNGLLVVSANGGTEGYTFEWSNGAIGPLLMGLIAGSYTVTVSDENGCTLVLSQDVTQPNPILPNTSTTGESAPGAMDGSVTATPTGGSGDYTYEWSNGETTATISGLSSGAYTVTVTDSNGCTGMQTAVVTGVNCTLAVTVSASNAACFGEASGLAVATVTGAQGSLSFLWTNGDTTAEASGLTAGMHAVTVTDSAGCLVITDVMVGQPEALFSICTAGPESMDGANDGIIVCIVAGGTAPYDFLWSNGDTTSVADSLAPGTYIVTITDSNGCTLQDTATVNAFSCMLSLVPLISGVDCYGGNSGTAAVVISGGLEPFVINWSNGESGMSIDSLTAGMYSVMVTDANDCISQFSFEISQPDSLVVYVDTIIPAVQGSGGEIQISVAGGVAPYTYLWTRNGTQVSTNEDLIDFEGGEYVLQVLDANGCGLLSGAITITLSTGTTNIAQGAVRIWPNPADDYLLLLAENPGTDLHATIYSATGQKIISQIFNSDIQSPTRIDIRSLDQGLYYIHVTTGDGERILPFVRL